MALFTPSASPSITVREIDLTGVVPGVTTSTGAFVGGFNWGPVEQPILVSNEAEMVEVFGSPSISADNSIDFLSASQFLKYSNSMYVVRGATSAAKNACHAGTAPTIKNLNDWNSQKTVAGVITNELIAKWPGSAGNSLSVKVCPWSTTNTAFDGWAYKSSFDAAPGTSAHVAEKSGNAAANDEVHVVVVDSDGVLSGVSGTVLEAFPFLSLATDAKTTDGATNYVLNVLNNKSQFIWASDISDYLIDATSAAFDSAGIHTVTTHSLTLGAQSATLTPTEYATGFDLFEDGDTIQVDFLIAPGMGDSADQVTVVNDLVGIASNVARRDCVVVTSPNRAAVVNAATPAAAVTSTVATCNQFTGSSYLIVDNNYLKVYDKYNDQYVFIPAASSTAGLMAATDDVAAPWFSPAGSRRGRYLGVTALSYSPNKTQRDTLYRVGINPIVNFPGQGITLFGDKTKETRPSAFDRINVRRLFLGIERAIKAASANIMFEFNDEFTRAEFVNIIEPFLREIQGRRGITDFRVVCDETNNTASVIDSNRLVASIFIKPARSINYVTLNFVAVRTGVEFEEIVGIV
jgi:hypothetical protein